MDRGSSTAYQTEIVKDQNKPFHLLEVHLDSGTQYLTDSYISISFNSNTYTPLGHFLSFSNIVETNELTVDQLSISLSGVEQTYTNLLLNENYIDRKVVIYQAFLNDSEALVSSPVQIFAGRINNPVIKEDVSNGTATLAVNVASQFVDFNKINCRYTNNESQQSFFEGDTGFRFASASVKELNWGLSTGATAQGYGSYSAGNGATSIVNNNSPSDKSIFTELSPTNSSMTFKAGSVLINISYANRPTTNFSVGDKIKINGFSTTTFSDGETITSAQLNYDEGAEEQSIVAIDSDGFGFDINAPSSITSVKSGKFGGSEITIDEQLINPVLIETTSGSNLITVNADNFCKVGDLVSFNIDTASVGGISDAILLDKHEVTVATKDTLTVKITQGVLIVADCIETTSGSNTITIDKYNHGLVIGDTFVMANATAVGGIPTSELNTTHTVVAQTSDNRFTITVTSNATSTARGGGLSTTIDTAVVPTNPIETTSGSTTIKVHKKAHGLSNNDTITLENIVTVGGITADTLNSTHTVVDATTSSDFFTITVSETAFSTEFGGGYGIYHQDVKASSSAKFGSPNATISMPTEIR